MPKSTELNGVFRGHKVFFHLLEIEMIIPLRTIVMVGQERYLVGGEEGNLIPLELAQVAYRPEEILADRDWHIELELEKKEGV